MPAAIAVEGLVYGFLALGVFVSFRVLDFPDLSPEGSFPFGAAVSSALVVAGVHPAFALAAAFAAGALAGACTSWIKHAFSVPPLLAGIATMTALYSIDLRVLGGRANLPLIPVNPVMDAARALAPAAGAWSEVLFFLAVAAAGFVALDLFFHTEVGLALGALGDNENVVVAAGADPVLLRTAGVALSNGLVGMSGALAAAYQGFADVNLGAGVVAAGLASVMIGEFLWKSQKIGLQLLRVLVGSILFRGLMYAGRAWGYALGITPNDLRLVTAVLVVASVAASGLGRRTRTKAAARRPATARGPADGGLR